MQTLIVFISIINTLCNKIGVFELKA